MSEFIGTREVAKLIGVNYAAFNTWLNAGLLGERFVHPGPGKGRERKFTLEDIVAARVTRDVMSYVGDLSVARDCVGVFRGGSTQKDFHLAIQLVQDHWSVFWSRPGLEWGDITMLIIPVQKIRKEMRGIFEAEPVKA